MNTENLLRQYIAAYEAKDLPAIETLLADEVCLQDWNLVANGKEAVLRETQANFKAAHSLQITIQRVFSQEEDAAAQLKIAVNDSATLEVVDVLSFNAAGLITAIRAYKG